MRHPAESARLGHLVGKLAPGFKADLVVLDLTDPSFVPLNSVARQLVHVEAGRAVKHVMADGRWVLRDRRITTVDETAIFREVATVMLELRKDFADITARVGRETPMALP